ncbi:MAG: PCYCGC motif-containing (lipo)protein [Candidatus Methanoperedens sp.]|nr:PCYCGC motif-containing (lipo)protein [Candidatus Methanoperedens sp.]
MKPESKANPERRTKKVKVQKKKGNSTLIIGIAAVILLAGIAYAILSSDSTSKKTTDSDIKLPSYAYTNPITLKAYKYAIEHPENLEQIPCYCGCGSHGSEASDYKPHRFLRDCFINDNWEFDEHGSFCDICIGEAIKTQDYLAKGKTIKEARALIDQEYGSKYPEGRTNTPAVRADYKQVLSSRLAAAPAEAASQPPSIDLSGLELPDNFKSLSNGLKLIPSGIAQAYFANMKKGIGIEDKFMQPVNFYGMQIIGMLNSDYPDGSWVELHDVGKAGVNVRSNTGSNADNRVDIRPYIYDTKDKTNAVLALYKDPASSANAYNSFKSLLDKVDDENAGFAKIYTAAPPFANAGYIGLIKSETGILGEINGEIAFRIKDNSTAPLAKYNELKNSSAARGFKSYDVRQENDILIVRMTSNLNNVIAEATQQYGIDIKVFG